ncbi:MAG: hypothetical protein E7066_09370 [Lentimicrobiaceae bacterium]|nr:hypothetical protein [Lentimicrobiaceae bacterium]
MEKITKQQEFINNDNDEILNETVINGSRVFVEDGEVKTILSESIQKSGYMSVEEGREITLAAIEKIYAMK